MFEHACFISYRHPPPTAPAYDEHFRARFVKEFRRTLEQYLTIQIRTYCDVELQQQPGNDYPRELSQKLCRSVCLIAIIVPDYWESGWTMGEWRAMEQLEQKRLGLTQLIIPVIVRGDIPTLAKRIGPRQYVDFSDVVKPTQLHNVKHLKKIESIARTVEAHVKTLSGLPIECDAFEIELGPAAEDPLAADPDPFAA